MAWLSYEARRRLRNVALYGVLVVLSFFICFPLIWAVTTSLKVPEELFAQPPTVLPQRITFIHYADLLQGGRRGWYTPQGWYRQEGLQQSHFVTWFVNSTVTALATVVISVVVSTLAAYSLTRFEYRLKQAIPRFVLVSYMIPSIIYVFPLFLVMFSLRLVDTLSSLILGYISICLPFSMWLMWAFFKGVPIDVEDAALIDGASRLKVFYQIALPMARPGIIATGIFSFIVAWNDYLLARIFINSMLRQTLPVGVLHFFEGVHVDWGLMMASAVLMTVPLLIAFMFVQKHLVLGFGAGAVKG